MPPIQFVPETGKLAETSTWKMKVTLKCVLTLTAKPGPQRALPTCCVSGSTQILENARLAAVCNVPASGRHAVNSTHC